MEKLLEKIDLLNYKYSLVKEENNFNIFEILRKRDDEVYLHSRFLTELLNPKGQHQMGNVFLKLFFDILGVSNDVCIEDNSSATYEKYIGELNKGKTQGGRIDIFIDNIGDSPIIIENKIYAEDQENQLLRYYNFSNKGRIYYLTLYGTEPSDYSLGGLDSSKIILLSYKNDINNWLSKCIEKSVKNPNLRESIIQYQQLVNSLTGNTTTMKERLEIYELLSQKDNIVNAHKIAENWVHIRWHTEFDFWECLHKTIESNSDYRVVKQQRYDESSITNIIHRVKNRNPWYGIVYKIANYKGAEIFLMIERGFENMYYGLRIDSAEDVRKDVANKIRDLGIEGDNEYWAGYKQFKQEINFESFSNKETLFLCNKEKREKIALEMFSQITEFVDECLNVLK